MSLHDDARRLDTLSLNAETVACALAAIQVLERCGWPALHERARLLAARFAEQLAARGREVAGQMTTPAESLTRTVDLLEEAVRRQH